jgi:hypothetical protein
MKRLIFLIGVITIAAMLVLTGCDSGSVNDASFSQPSQTMQKPNGGGGGDFQPGSKPKTANPKVLPKLDAGSHSYGVVDLEEFTPQEYAQNGVTADMLSAYIDVLKKRDDCSGYVARLTDKLNQLKSNDSSGASSK